MSLAKRETPRGGWQMSSTDPSVKRGGLRGAKPPHSLALRTDRDFVAWEEEPVDGLELSDLVARLPHREVSVQRKLDILGELDFRGEEMPAESLAELLEGIDPPSADPSWTAALVNEAIRTRVVAPAERQRLSLALLWVAEQLNRHGPAENPTLWAALRRGSSLLLPRELDRLLVFLAPNAALTTQQAALQAIEAKCTVVDEPLPEKVKRRVSSLAESCLAESLSEPQKPEREARCASALAAAILMGSPRAEDLTRELAARGPRTLQWLVSTILEEAARHRSSLGARRAEIPELVAALQALRGDDREMGAEKRGA